MRLLVRTGALPAASRLSSETPDASPTLTLDAIAAIIIGGTSLFGTRASVTPTRLGALLIAVLSNGMVLLNVNVDAQCIVEGLILLLAAVLERVAVRAQRAYTAARRRRCGLLAGLRGHTPGACPPEPGARTASTSGGRPPSWGSRPSPCPL
jgi:hypothetical protein